MHAIIFLGADAPPQVLRLDLYLVFGIGFCILMVIILVLLTGVFQHQKHQQTTRRHIEETSLTPSMALKQINQSISIGCPGPLRCHFRVEMKTYTFF